MNWKFWTYKKTFPKATDHPVAKAFTSGGIDYYQFVGEMPIWRQFRALAYYREFSMRVTDEFLGAHCDAMEAIFNSKKEIKLTDIMELYMQLQERRKLIFEPNTLYKLASVFYFDKNENPYDFDQTYADKKILKWKKDNDVKAFFLHKLLSDLMPALQMSPSDLENYFQVSNQIIQKHLESISTILSKEGKKSLLPKSPEWESILGSMHDDYPITSSMSTTKP